jgi:hypothetical protein
MRSSGCRAPWQGYRLTCSQVSPRVQTEFAKGRLVMLPELEVKMPTLPSALPYWAARGQAAACWPWLLAERLACAAPIERNTDSHTNSSRLRY